MLQPEDLEYKPWVASLRGCMKILPRHVKNTSWLHLELFGERAQVSFEARGSPFQTENGC